MATENYANILQAIMEQQKQYRKDNPVQLYFEPGTPTLASRELEQQAQLAREQMAQEAALAREQMALQRKLASMGGGGGGGYNLTQTEKKMLATSQWMQHGDLMYQKYLNSVSPKTGKKYQYPLYYTLSNLMNNKAERTQAMALGVDLKAVVDYLIGKYTKMTPEQYFKTATGKKLAGSYYALGGRVDSSDLSGSGSVLSGSEEYQRFQRMWPS
jgi:hypothetical protein